MRTNIEIEFKCKLDEETYERLLKELHLANLVFLQTNFYFDTKGKDLLDRKLVLRIRKKGNSYKLTLKSQGDHETFERHIILNEDKADELLKNGFNTKDYFDFEYFVTHEATLENYRVSMVYENGKLFFDKSIHNGITDYELEYEALEYHKGEEIFKNFLKKESIPFKVSKKKSERAFGR